MNDAKRLTVLVVDDEEGLRTAIAFEFKRQGYDVLTAENGRKARELLEANEIHAVVSDVRMPGVDGIELLEWIKGRRPRTPHLIFVTAFADLSVEDAYAMGAEAILAKPFDRKELRSAIAQCLLDKRARWSETPDEAEGIEDLHWPGPPPPDSRGAIAIGAGGIFVPTAAASARPGALLRFHFPNDAFEIGMASSIKGTGIVRWTRAPSATGKSAGFGLEIRTLEKFCIENFLAGIERLQKKSFIPAA